MKRLGLILVFLLIPVFAFADRNLGTTTMYKATTQTGTLVKTGDAKVYSASFVASAAGGFFVILNATSNTTSTGAVTDVKAEGSEATSLNGKYYDFTAKPLELSTGLYVIVSNGYLILNYE